MWADYGQGIKGSHPESVGGGGWIIQASSNRSGGITAFLIAGLINPETHREDTGDRGDERAKGPQLLTLGQDIPVFFRIVKYTTGPTDNTG